MTGCLMDLVETGIRTARSHHVDDITRRHVDEPDSRNLKGGLVFAVSWTDRYKADVYRKILGVDDVTNLRQIAFKAGATQRCLRNFNLTGAITRDVHTDGICIHQR